MFLLKNFFFFAALLTTLANAYEYHKCNKSPSPYDLPNTVYVHLADVGQYLYDNTCNTDFTIPKHIRLLTQICTETNFECFMVERYANTSYISCENNDWCWEINRNIHCKRKIVPIRIFDISCGNIFTINNEL